MREMAELNLSFCTSVKDLLTLGIGWHAHFKYSSPCSIIRTHADAKGEQSVGFLGSREPGTVSCDYCKCI